MVKADNLENLINKGSSTVYFSLNTAVPSHEIWTKGNGLEKAVGIKNPGDAVSLIGIKKYKNDKKEAYFLHGVYELMPFSVDAVDDDGYKQVHNKMIPGVAYINPSSVGIKSDELGSIGSETGPVKSGKKEFLGIINLDYLTRLDSGKINERFTNGAYLNMKPTKDGSKFVEPSEKHRIINNVGQGAGLISSTITDKIADRYGFPRPSPGDVIVGIGYFGDSIKSYKDQEPYAFPMVVSAIGNRMQVPSDVIDSMYFEVILGVDKRTGVSLV
jgi:hypothetical protein